MQDYKKRIADKLLEIELSASGAVLIEGPKWCGKTTTAEQIAKSVFYLSNPENESYLNFTSSTIYKKILSGETPRLIDEWQLKPKLWDAIRFEVDHREGVGHFILTGSTTPISTKEIHHTGTGRFTYLLMRTMSLYESLDSTGEVSLEELFFNPDHIEGFNKLDIDELSYLICRGGWPGAINLKHEVSLRPAFNYYESIIHSESSLGDGISKNRTRMRNIMRSYARHQGTQVNLSQIREDVIKNDTETISTDTILTYINALKRIFVIEEMEARNTNLRSKASIRSSNTRFFIDPSIAAASLNIGPNDLIHDLNTFGFLFETMCIRDLRIYTDALNGTVYHYRDSDGLECDAVIHLKNGKYGLIEIKLGGDVLIEEAAKNLLRLKNKIDTTKMNEPSFLMIIVGLGQFAYKRNDGIFVVPIGCLKD